MQKKTPQRTCLGCQAVKDKRSLIRVVKNKEGEFFIDFTGKKNGRGAYICPSLDCFNKAKKAKRLERAFSCQIPPEIYQKLEEELKKDG